MFIINRIYRIIRIKCIHLFLYACLFHNFIYGQSSVKPAIIKGLSFVAPHKPFETNPFIPIKNINADWIAVIPYAFTRTDEPIVHYDHNEKDRKWWGEGRKGIEETIKQAQLHGLKIMLKPQIWCRGGWIGSLDFEKKSDWEKWEKSYEEYILPFADLAEEKCLDILCIGTEIKQSAIKRPEFWNHLIHKIRSRYSGMITYAANWDEYDQIRFWSKLDYVGIDAYFPLSDKITPEMTDLMDPLEEILSTIGKFSKQLKKKILFTEYGYLSVDGCAGKTWELESNLTSLNYNPTAQANAIQTLLECCSKKDFWAGGFIWKWYPETHTMRRGLEKDHSPQGKLAEEVLKICYGKM